MSHQKPQWLIYAIASGACAALNGVFAKLTTTELTSKWALIVSHRLSQTEYNGVVEYAVRAVR